MLKTNVPFLKATQNNVSLIQNSNFDQTVQYNQLTQTLPFGIKSLLWNSEIDMCDSKKSCLSQR